MPSYTIPVPWIPPKYKTQSGYSPWTDPTQAPLMRALRDIAARIVPAPAPRSSSVTLRVRIHASRSDGDLDNFLMAINDALQGDKSGVATASALWSGAIPAPDVAVAFENDATIDHMEADRVSPKDQARREYEVEVAW